jgi:hypothetical protein
VSYWIGKSGSDLIAKVWLTNKDAEPKLLVRQKVIPQRYRERLPRATVDRLGRLREKQASDAIAKQVVILTKILSVGLQGSCILFCILTPNYYRLAHRQLFSLTRLLFSYLSLTRALFSLLRIHLRILGSLSLGNYRSRAP